MNSNSQVGIDLNLTTNASQVAGEAARSLEGLKDKFKELAGSMDPDEARRYFEVIEAGGRAQSVQLDNESKRLRNQQVQNRAGGGPSSIQGGVGVVQSAVGTTSGSIVQAGRGDAAGAGGSVLGGLGGILTKLGPLGLGAGAALGLAGAAVGGLNSISKIYEEVVPEMLDLTAAMGELSEGSRKVRDNMSMVSETAGEFGYNLQQGSAVFRGLIESGAGRDGLSGDASTVMNYARGFGVSPASLARYQGMASRFGFGQNALSYGAGGLAASGMEEGRLQEYLNATLSVFEEGLSRGVVRGFESISSTQNFLASLGPQYQGSLGAQMFGRLNQSVVGATGLGSEMDVIKFRAAQRLAGGGNYIDAMKYLEGGFNPELFGAVRSDIRSMAPGDRTSQIELMRQAFGVNYTQADDLLRADVREAGAILGGKPPGGQTNEEKLLGFQESISNSVRLISSNVMDLKTGVMGDLADLMEGIAGEATKERLNQTPPVPVAEVGKMFVDSLHFDYVSRERIEEEQQTNALNSILRASDRFGDPGTSAFLSLALRGVTREDQLAMVREYDQNNTGMLDTRTELDNFVQAIRENTAAIRDDRDMNVILEEYMETGEYNLDSIGTPGGGGGTKRGWE